MSISATAEWKKLECLAKEHRSMSLREAFSSDSARFNKYSINLNCDQNELLFDWSKNLINADIMEGLYNLARRANVEKMRSEMFGGERINFTEKRAVLHVALRHQG
mgnify:CR=1 FL=1